MFTNKVSGEECINLEEKCCELEWKRQGGHSSPGMHTCLRACAHTLVCRRRLREVWKVSGDSEEVNAKRIFFFKSNFGFICENN